MNKRGQLVGLLAQQMRKTFAEDLADEILANGFFNLSHIMLLEVEEDYKTFRLPKVVLFNENHMTQEEALRIVKSGEYHHSVISMPKRQWESLFLNQSEPGG